jgi:hypothetical protein
MNGDVNGGFPFQEAGRAAVLKQEWPTLRKYMKWRQIRSFAVDKKCRHSSVSTRSDSFCKQLIAINSSALSEMRHGILNS